MGVTIHFEGRLRDRAAYERVLERVSMFASSRGWRTEPINTNEITLQRIRNEEPWDYTGPTMGLAVHPHDACEPLRFEFDRDLVLQEYVKTQFAPVAVHIAIVELLRDLEAEFAELLVDDEGEYWETRNPDILTKHLQACFTMMNEEMASDATLQGPFRLPSGRIADLVRH